MSIEPPRPPAPPRPAPTAAGRVLSSAGRIWVPAALTVAGIVLIVRGGGHVRGEQVSDVAGSTAGYGLVLLLVALFVLGVSWLSRMNRQSSRDREREEAARRYFDLHGRWPEDDDDEFAGANSFGSSADGGEAAGSVAGAELPGPKEERDL